MRPVDGQYLWPRGGGQRVLRDEKDNTATGSSFAIALQEVGNQEHTSPVNFTVPRTAAERTQLWNYLAREAPHLLESTLSPGSSRETRAREIQDKLTAAGVDFTTAVLIANREASTVVRRSDGLRPGPYLCGVETLPESIRSEPLAENSQVRKGTGYAYVDRYGFPHVVKDLATALNYSGDGKVYEYSGRFGGGYALDEDNSRAMLELPEARMYANAGWKAAEGGEEVEARLPGSPAGKLNLQPLAREYIDRYFANMQPAYPADLTAAEE